MFYPFEQPFVFLICDTDGYDRFLPHCRIAKGSCFIWANKITVWPDMRFWKNPDTISCFSPLPNCLHKIVHRRSRCSWDRDCTKHLYQSAYFFVGYCVRTRDHKCPFGKRYQRGNKCIGKMCMVNIHEVSRFSHFSKCFLVLYTISSNEK